MCTNFKTQDYMSNIPYFHFQKIYIKTKEREKSQWYLPEEEITNITAFNMIFPYDAKGHSPAGICVISFCNLHIEKPNLYFMLMILFYAKLCMDKQLQYLSMLCLTNRCIHASFRK